MSPDHGSGLVDLLVEVGAEALELTTGAPAKAATSIAYRGDESPACDRDELAHGNAIAGDHVGLSPVQAAHDLAALVAKLALGDRPWRHEATV